MITFKIYNGRYHYVGCFRDISKMLWCFIYIHILGNQPLFMRVVWYINKKGGVEPLLRFLRRTTWLFYLLSSLSPTLTLTLSSWGVSLIIDIFKWITRFMASHFSKHFLSNFFIPQKKLVQKGDKYDRTLTHLSHQEAIGQVRCIWQERMMCQHWQDQLTFCLELQHKH